MENEQNQKKKKMTLDLKGSFRFDIAPFPQFRMLMIVAVSLVMISVAFHLYLFYGVESRNIFGTTDGFTQQGPKVNEKKLEKILSRYSFKETVRSTAIGTAPIVLDPSK